MSAGAPAVQAEYLPLPSLAVYSGLSVRTLRSFLTHPATPLPCYRVGARVLVRRADYDAWAARFRVQAPATVDTMAANMMRGL